MDEAQALAERLAAGPTLGLGLTKRLIQAAATNTLDAQLDMERDLQRAPGAAPTMPRASPPSSTSASRSSVANDGRSRMTPQELAEASARAMWNDDSASQGWAWRSTHRPRRGDAFDDVTAR
jgi:2-hydroxychromene-2-carboxylate isomerase